MVSELRHRPPGHCDGRPPRTVRSGKAGCAGERRPDPRTRGRRGERERRRSRVAPPFSTRWCSTLRGPAPVMDRPSANASDAPCSPGTANRFCDRPLGCHSPGLTAEPVSASSTGPQSGYHLPSLSRAGVEPARPRGAPRFERGVSTVPSTWTSKCPGRESNSQCPERTPASEAGVSTDGSTTGANVCSGRGSNSHGP